ncbi:MAG: thioredoxin family protein [Phycisphaerales bacterium]
MRKLEMVVMVVALVALAGFIGWRTFRPPAPTPGAFAGQTRLAAAIEQSNETGRPVIALATADWCPPCQALKRGALVDARVASLIDERAIPVYVDVDKHPDEARQLGAASIPTTYVIRNGEITAKVTGALAPDDYLGWLERSIGG